MAELVSVLRWRWKPALVYALLFMLGTVLVVRSLPSEYDGTTLISISPRPSVPSATSDTVRVVAPKYAAYATARPTVERAATAAGLDSNELEGAANATLAQDTGNLYITVRLKSPTRAAQGANAIGTEVLRAVQRDALLTGETVFPATTPRSPSAPPRRLLDVIGACLGILLGIGFALLLERARPRARSWRTLSEVTGLPVIGRIPRSRRLRSTRNALADPVAGTAFRTLRANLEPRLRAESIETIVVTSPGTGDGKTTVAAVLSESLARLGKRVLLVDADMHRPQLARVSGAPGDGGLSAVLRGQAGLAKAVRKGWHESLSLLPTLADQEASDLIARRFAGVIADAQARFDITVIDTPPLLGPDDARSVAAAAQGVLLVVGAGSPVSQISEAVDVLDALGVPVLGVVGNRFKGSSVSAYY